MWPPALWPRARPLQTGVVIRNPARIVRSPAIINPCARPRDRPFVLAAERISHQRRISPTVLNNTNATLPRVSYQIFVIIFYSPVRHESELYTQEPAHYLYHIPHTSSAPGIHYYMSMPCCLNLVSLRLTLYDFQIVNRIIKRLAAFSSIASRGQQPVP